MVVTSFPVKLVLRKPEVSVRLAKWAVEQGVYDIICRPATAIKSQVLADFLAEFSLPCSQLWSRRYASEAKLKKRENGFYTLMDPATSEELE